MRIPVCGHLFGWTIWRAKDIIGNPSVYAKSQKMARKQATRILDLLQE